MRPQKRTADEKLAQIRGALIGKKIIRVLPTNADEGLFIVTEDDHMLVIGYSSLQGFTCLDGEEQDVDWCWTLEG